jgi:N-acetyl-anhydromuramyl-L-alanine amidase AmpD
MTMRTSPSFRLSLGVFSALTLLAPACDEEHVEDANDVADDEIVGEQADVLDPPTVDPGLPLAGLDRDFADAADEYGVPTPLLQAIGHVETQWQMIEGLSEFEGQEPAFGVMALRGEQLRRGAELAGTSVDKVKTDRRANLRAGAALLSAYADELALERSDLGAWAPAVARFSGIPDTLIDVQANYVHHDVYARMRTGVTVKDLAGNQVAELEPVEATPDFTAPLDPSAAQGPDYAASVWRPSPNYSSRAAGTVGTIKMVIIHSCEGAYSGCWGWLVNAQAGVSAHYVVKEDGSEISQLVKEANKAWHIGASYDCKLDSGKECQLNGYNANNFTIGIEHAGFAKQASWNSNLINNSAKLVCDMSKAHAIPRDKYHVVAHGQLQPYNRIDPGPNWPWATYLAKINEYCGAAPAPPPPPDPAPVTTIIVDSNNANNDATKAKIAVSANWTSSAATPGYYGSGYWFANTSPVSDAAEFSFYLPAAASRTVDAWWTAGTNRSATAPFVAFNAQGTKLGTVNANQQTNGGKWVQLGTFNFTAGWNKVVLSRWTTEGSVVVADAVRIR